jgi:deoxyribodipyrimidine photolyase-related protein
MARPLAAMRKLDNLPAVRERAVEILDRLDRGDL